MALRIFGRKTTTRRTEPANASTSAKADATEASAPSTRRRRTSTSASPKPEAAAPKTAPEKSAGTDNNGARSTGSRTRRGRRGGVGRKKPSTTGATTTTAAAAPATIVPLRSSDEPITLERLMEQQIAALTGLQGSLSAIETRLSPARQQASAAPAPRVGIFVDVPNVIYAAERQRVTLDFGKVLDFLVRGRELVRASAYSPISDDPQAKLESSRFVQPFVGHGYRFVTKPYKRYADGSMKANFDVELAIDILTMSDRLDIVTLVSGDGDFRRLVELVASKGVRVEVVAFGNSTAAELRAIADEYIDLNDHIAELRP